MNTLHSKTLLSTLIAFALALQLASAQDELGVHLKPNKDSPIIGTLQSPSEIIDAEWPAAIAPTPGWQPIYYRGNFEVYVSNSDLTKELNPKPGSPYLLDPKKPDEYLALATDEDIAEAISVDPRYCKFRVDTIILGYIVDSGSDSAAEETPAEKVIEEYEIEIQEEGANPGGTLMKELQGRLKTNNLIEKTRTGLGYKLVDQNAKILAFLDVSELPDYLILKDYVGFQVKAFGHVESVDGISAITLRLNSLKKAK